MDKRHLIPSRRVKVKSLPQGLSPGDRIEARPCNADELFYAGIIIGRDPKSDPYSPTTYTVLYDDGDVECGLFATSIISYCRRAVYYGQSVLVDDGTILVSGQFRRVRLLHFRTTPGIYQSGILMSSTSVNTQDFSLLPFEVNQAMVLGVALFAWANKWKLPERVCVAGLGGGAVASCIAHQLCPKSSVDALEISAEVALVARTYFGVPSNVDIILKDAFEWLSQTTVENDVAYDLLIIDVMEEDDRFLPPERFLNVEFVENLTRKHGSVCVINVFKSSSAPNHVQNAARTFVQANRLTYVAFVDPNYIFFIINDKEIDQDDDERQMDSHMLERLIDQLPKLKSAVPGVLRELSTRPKLFWRPVRELLD